MGVLRLALLAHDKLGPTACREQVAATVEGIVGTAIVPNQPFMEAGLDSLGAVDLRNALGARFGVELPATATFDFPTVLAMAAHISAMLDTARQVAAPQWPGSAIAAPGSDFGEPTSAAVQVVGLSCVYPGQHQPLCSCTGGYARVKSKCKQTLLPIKTVFPGYIMYFAGPAGSTPYTERPIVGQLKSSNSK